MMLAQQDTKQFTFKRFHLTIGIAGVLLFIASGMYMRILYHGLKEMSDLPRMLFRSSHIYLLMTSLINLAIGLYLSPSKRWHVLQWIGSILILVSPALMVIAFLKEPARMSFHRTFAGPGIYAIFAGILLHLLSALKSNE